MGERGYGTDATDQGGKRRAVLVVSNEQTIKQTIFFKQRMINTHIIN